MFFTREIKVTILGNMGVGKTALVKRLKGDSPLETTKTLDISVETKKVKLRSSLRKSKLSLERHRWYKILAVDSPGDYKLRRKWREAMKKYATDGIIFMIDPTQPIPEQRVAMEDAYNYYLDSIHLEPDKADQIAKNRKTIFFFVINKMDMVEWDFGRASEIMAALSDVMDTFKESFPLSKQAEWYISVHESPLEDIESIFERAKLFLYGH